jgi:PKD domain
MLPRRSLLLAAALVSAALSLPAVASAKDYCIGAPAGCTGMPAPKSVLASGLTAVASDGADDRFFLAPGVYAAPSFDYQSSERLQLIGAGAGKTILRGSIATPVLTLGGNQDSLVSDLTIEPTVDAASGLRLLGTRAQGVAVDAKGSAGLDAGVEMFGDSTFAGGSVDLHTLPKPAAMVFTGNGTVTDSRLTAPAGYAFVSGGEGTVRRSTLDATVGAWSARGHMTISDSLIDLRGNVGPQATAGVAASTSYDASVKSATADADRVTIVSSSATTLGVLAEADGAGETVAVHLRDSVIDGAGVPLARSGTNGATADITTDRSDYPAALDPNYQIGAGNIVEQHHLTASPRFAGDGDFRLAADSPLVDAATPGTPPAGTTDRDGKPRSSDGNGDCLHVSDIGAYELQGTKAKAVATAGAASVAAGRPVGFSSAGSCIPGPEAPTIRWSFDDGAVAAGATVTHAFTTPGRHTATVTVTDGHGHAAQATASVDVTAPAAAAPAAPAASAPRISRLRVAPTRVQIGSRLPKLVRTAVRRPLATIHFRLSKRATVTLRFAKVGRHGTTRTLKTKVRIKARKGRNRIRFAARLTRTVALAPGIYRLTAVATTRAGARSKRARTRFTASKPPRR